MHLMKHLSCALCIATATQVSAQTADETAAKPVPHQGYMSVLLTDKCVVTAGRAMPESKRFERAVAHIEYRATTKSAEIAIQPKIAAVDALAVAAAKQVIQFGFDKLETAVKNNARDRVSGFSSIAPINAYEIHPREDISNVDPKNTKAATHLHQIKLNPALRCVTVVTSVAPVTNMSFTAQTDHIFTSTESEERSLTPWNTDGNWETAGPPNSFVDKRLEWAGFLFSNDTPATVFEARLDFSEDFSAVRFVPLYFAARNFSDKNGTLTQKAVRHLSTTLNITDPTSAKPKVLSHTFNDIKVQVDNGETIVGNVSSQNGFGPQLARAYFGESGWLPFAAPSSKVSQTLSKELQRGTTTITQPMGLKPVNVQVTHVATEKASEFALQLAKFFDSQDVGTKLSNALIEELDLKSPDDQATAALALIDSKIDIVNAQIAYLNAVGGEEEKKKELLKRQQQLTLQKVLLNVDCTLNGPIPALSDTIDPDKILALTCQ